MKRKKRESRVDFLKEVFPEIFGMINIICLYLNVDFEEVKAKRRFRELVDARQIICYFIEIYFKNKITLSDVGHLVNIDHASVLHAKKMVQNHIQTSKNYKSTIYEIKCLIEEKYEKEIKAVANFKNKTEMLDILAKIEHKNKSLNQEFEEIVELKNSINTLLEMINTLNLRIKDLSIRIKNNEPHNER